MRETELCQYYYTSYRHTRTGRAGFQIKALSRGMTAETQAVIARLIGYRSPPDLDAQAYGTHPVALRYHCEDGSDMCVLVCSRSCGSDEYGRPGNFFAHAVAGDRSFFRHTAPICFWQSPFWQAEDPQEREAIDFLPEARAIEAGKALMIDAIWHFLGQGKRRPLLYKLLCAVIQSHVTQRRIIVVDSDEHVACWIAAVSYLLPPRWRTRLTFTTYHHDPRQTQYMIIGVHKMGSESILRDEQIYFVLDGKKEKAGAVVDSPYARLALEAAYPQQYEEQLQPLFAEWEILFPEPERIDERLDTLALYSRSKQSAYVFLPEERESIRSMLQSSLPLPEEIEEAFFLAVCDSLSLVDSSENEIALCQRYRRYESLPARAREAVENLVALSQGKIAEEQIAAIRQDVVMLSREQYRVALKRWVGSFARQAVSRDAYARFVRAMLVDDRQKNEEFWQFYLEVAQKLLHESGLNERVLWIVDSFFVLAPSSLPGDYTLQQGLMILGASSLLQERKFGHDLLKASQYPWQVSLLLICGRSWLKEVGATLLAGMRRRGPEEDQKGALEEIEAFTSTREAIEWLFEEEQLLKRHRRLLDIYRREDGRIFWSVYWRKMLVLLQEDGGIDVWLCVLTFWFEEAYDCLGCYLSQEFWLGLPGMLQRARRVRACRQGMSNLSERIASEVRWGEYILSMFG